MRLSRSLLRSAILLAVSVTAGCDRDVDPVTSPTRVPTAPNELIIARGFVDVSVGSQYGCAIRSGDSSLVCWGDNEFGKATPPTGRYRQVSAGIDHACALRADYYAVCWGSADLGGNSPPTLMFTQVSVGRGYGCGVRGDTQSVACWGSNLYGKATPPTFAFSQVSATEYHTCGVRLVDASAVCWGSNTGNPPPGPYTQLDAGRNFTCAVRGTGIVTCWGVNDVGQSSPPSGTYTQVSSAYTHSCAIRASDRGIVCWV